MFLPPTSSQSGECGWDDVLRGILDLSHWNSLWWGFTVRDGSVTKTSFLQKVIQIRLLGQWKEELSYC